MTCRKGTPVADLTTRQRAALFIDGSQWNADTPGVASSDPTVATVGAGPDGKFYVFGQGVGDADITVTFAGRTGSLTVSVASEPYVLTLGAPESK